jgi:hypothetical protein
MGKFIRDRLPDPLDYYTNTAGLQLTGKGKWRTSRCDNHGGSDSMRINIENGAYVCMAGCGARGGDVLAYHRWEHGLGFVEAAEALGAYDADGKPYDGPARPTQPPPRALLQLASDDLYYCAVVVSAVRAALNEFPSVMEALDGRLSHDDMDDFMPAAGRVIYIAGVANA